MRRKTVVRSNTYHDSVVLMAISREAAAVQGVVNAIAVMGSEMNKEFLANVGLLDNAASVAGPEDLVIAIEAGDDETIARALGVVEERLKERVARSTAGEREQPPRSLESALQRAPDTNLALVSVPGEFAAREARRALLAGLHVMLYSDNVSLEDEVALKALATEKGLLCMGPDCGTAIIGGVGLGFANAVRPGPIGIVAASGTGLQEAACLIDRLGSGVSHAIGTGGRDLSAQVGGAAMRQGIRMLGDDPATRLILLISKPPDPAVAQAVLEEARRTGKPVVVCFLGGDATAAEAVGARFTATLEAAATAAVSAVAGARAEFPTDPGLPGAVAQAVRDLDKGQKYVRGLFTGGTLCDEAAQVLGRHLGAINSNTAKDPARRLAGGAESREHSLWDLGDDYFTVGRPHPMIEPGLRQGPLGREAADPAVAVVLLDVVLGHGCHPDPAGSLAPAIQAARETARAGGRSLAIVASVTGTETDPQRLSSQVARLRAAGAIVAPTAARAAAAAAAIAARRPELVGEG